jgi:hypothetical protein
MRAKQPTALVGRGCFKAVKQIAEVALFSLERAYGTARLAGKLQGNGPIKSRRNADLRVEILGNKRSVASDSTYPLMGILRHSNSGLIRVIAAIANKRLYVEGNPKEYSKVL